MTNMKSLQTLIAANNGKLSTAVIAEKLGKTHQHLCDKLKSQIDDSLLTNFVTKEMFTKGRYKTIKSERTIYLLPEVEAMALAMSYDMKIGMEVYNAFKAYEAALVAVTDSETLEEAKAVANKALDVHAHMAIKKPLHRIRQYLDTFESIEEAVSTYIKAMHNNAKANYTDRTRTLTSLTKAVDESYDNLSARDRNAVFQHEAALKLIAREERYQARLQLHEK